jgi:hypothetical protein
MSILKNFVNLWGLDTSVLDTVVLDTDVLKTSVLETDVLDNPFSPTSVKEEFVATIHGSWWWNDCIFKYLYPDVGHPLAEDALAALIQGAFFKHKNITDKEGTAKKDELQYRNKNWGYQNAYPITIRTGNGKPLKNIKELMQNEGSKFKIRIRVNEHDENNKYMERTMDSGCIVFEKIVGLNATQGVHYWPAWFVMTSPMGKLARGNLFRTDPWTGQDLTDSDKFAMTLDGVMDLLTFGTSLAPAAWNQVLNIGAQILENNAPEYSTHIAVIKELFEIGTSIKGLKPAEIAAILTNSAKGLPTRLGEAAIKLKEYESVELVANLIQLRIIAYNNGIFETQVKKSGGQEATDGLAKQYRITYEENT